MQVQMQMRASPPQTTLIKYDCKHWIDINSTQMNNKLQFWIELNSVKSFYKTYNVDENDTLPMYYIFVL
jgi:hypothetical protein